MLRIPLNANPEQLARLRALQVGFARVCNALAPMVKETRVWNRVALHHLAYRQMREQFPEMGSQMVCNAIYSVSRACRIVFQHPQSPFHLSQLQGKPLPLLRFADSCPVYFDRHTLSLKDGLLSMFTLDGRMRFQLTLAPQAEQAFHGSKLREIVLGQRADGLYELSFLLDGPQGGATGADGADGVGGVVPQAGVRATDPEIPEYLIVEEEVS